MLKMPAWAKPVKKGDRDSDGCILQTWAQKWKSWRLARKIKKGKVPRGRVSSRDAIASVRPHGKFEGNCSIIRGFLSAKVFRASGEIDDIGLISVKKVTVAFRNYIVDSLQNSTTHAMDIFKYHASGTGSTAEANDQTALVTEAATRVAGTQIEGATADIFKTVATIPYTGTLALREHAVLSAASDGTMMDRSLFDAINVVDGDSVEYTYEITFNEEA